MPCDIARLSDGTTAFGSLAEIAIALTFCEVSVLMYETCDDALASDGPTRLPLSPSSLSALRPPLSEIVKYGLLICLGRNATLRPFLIDALASAEPDDEAEPELELWSFFVEPHAPIASAAASAATATPRLRVMTLLRWVALRGRDGAAAARCARPGSARGRRAAAGCR